MRFLVRLLLLSALSLLMLLGTLFYLANSKWTVPASAGQVVIQQGSGVRAVARQLQQAGVISSPLLFEAWVRFSGHSGRIKAGNYMFSGELAVVDVLRLLIEGDVTQSSLRFIEGWNMQQIRAALADNAALRHDTADMSTSELAQAIGVEAATPEGWIFPDTYHFSSGLSELQVLRRAYRQMQQVLQGEWENRDTGLPYASPYQALIMASIIEKETGLASERPMIAAVFINRLRIGMRLQTDPTVIYGVGENFDGNLTRLHLQTDTPYNTYTRSGLPPTPIAMPGWESIRAALHPATSRALYFVARGDGGHVFSNNLADHNAAVQRYQKRRRGA